VQLADGMAKCYWAQAQGGSSAVDFGELCGGLCFVCNQSTLIVWIQSKAAVLVKSQTPVLQ